MIISEMMCAWLRHRVVTDGVLDVLSNLILLDLVDVNSRGESRCFRHVELHDKGVIVGKGPKQEIEEKSS